MKTRLNRYIIFFTLIIFLFPCKSKSNEEVKLNDIQNSERPSQAITYPEMASMFKGYDNGQRIVLNNYITNKTEGKDSIETISQFFSL
jgi:hypothetical protein